MGNGRTDPEIAGEIRDGQLSRTTTAMRTNRLNRSVFGAHEE